MTSSDHCRRRWAWSTEPGPVPSTPIDCSRTSPPWQYGQWRKSRPQRSRAPGMSGSSSTAPAARSSRRARTVRPPASPTVKPLVGTTLELFLILANVGTALVLFPVLKRQNEILALGYLAARVVECVFIAVGILSLPAVVTLRRAIRRHRTRLQRAVHLLDPRDHLGA